MANRATAIEDLMDLSLDEYIQAKKIKPLSYPDAAGVSRGKFDRFRDAEDEEEDEDDDDHAYNGNVKVEDADVSMESSEPLYASAPAPVTETAKTVTNTQNRSFGAKPKPNRVWANRFALENDNSSVRSHGSFQSRSSVHSRLGNRGYQHNRNNSNRYSKNNMESDRVRNLQLSVQNRLQPEFLSSARALSENMRASCGELMRTFAGQLVQEVKNINEEKAKKTEQKYNMAIQKDISTIQNKPLFYTCPGAAVVSSDGVGLDEQLAIPHNATGMTLNQRFA